MSDDHGHRHCHGQKLTSEATMRTSGLSEADHNGLEEAES
jgi:hypothetical protein